jgi:hypothetical protein
LYSNHNSLFSSQQRLLSLISNPRQNLDIPQELCSSLRNYRNSVMGIVARNNSVSQCIFVVYRHCKQPRVTMETETVSLHCWEHVTVFYFEIKIRFRETVLRNVTGVESPHSQKKMPLRDVLHYSVTLLKGVSIRYSDYTLL